MVERNVSRKKLKRLRKPSKKKQIKPSKTKETKKKLHKMEGCKIPNVKLQTRVKNTNVKKSKSNKNSYKWKTISTNNLFKNKKSVVFSLPGAYTPTCSNSHLPDYEKKYNELKKKGVNDVYCVSVNDPFVMHNWKNKHNIKNVKMIPDGNGAFTKKMGALVKKNNLGFGDRSWRYSMFIDNGKIKKIFSESNMSNNHKSDPFKVSDVDTMINYLSNKN